MITLTRHKAEENTIKKISNDIAQLQPKEAMDKLTRNILYDNINATQAEEIFIKHHKAQQKHIGRLTGYKLAKQYEYKLIQKHERQETDRDLTTIYVSQHADIYQPVNLISKNIGLQLSNIHGIHVKDSDKIKSVQDIRDKLVKIKPWFNTIVMPYETPRNWTKELFCDVFDPHQGYWCEGKNRETFIANQYTVLSDEPFAHIGMWITEMLHYNRRNHDYRIDAYHIKPEKIKDVLDVVKRIPFHIEIQEGHINIQKYDPSKPAKSDTLYPDHITEDDIYNMYSTIETVPYSKLSELKKPENKNTAIKKVAEIIQNNK